MGDNNLDYKKAYDEFLEKQKEIEKREKKRKEAEREKAYKELLKEKEERQKEIEKENEELLKEEKKCIMTSTSQSTSNHESCQLKQSTWVGIPNFEDLLEKNGNKESNALKLCGLEEELSIISQEDIIGLQPDYWLVKSKTNYIGLIEVKSNEHSFHDPKVIGQLFDYLIGLSYLFGKLQAFGLLLTHNQVMPLFTQDSLELAANHIQSTPPHATSALPNQISKTAKVKPNTKVFDRVLYTSIVQNTTSPTYSSSNTTSPPTSNSSSNTTSPAFSSSNTTSPILSSSSPVRDIEKPREFFELICSTIFKMRESQFDPNKEGQDLEYTYKQILYVLRQNRLKFQPEKILPI
ncbi:hypothetical protein ACTFIU_011251 [Dictyostelium citrinum]